MALRAGGAVGEQLLDAPPLPLGERVGWGRVRPRAQAEAAHHAHPVQRARLQQRQLLDVLGKAPADAVHGAAIAPPTHGPVGHLEQGVARADADVAAEQLWVLLLAALPGGCCVGPALDVEVVRHLQPLLLGPVGLAT